MKVEWRREPGSRAVLQVELPREEVARAVAAAHRRLAQRVRIPGFRRGKAPRTILERYVGRESLMDETLKLLLPEGYARALKETGLSPIGQPQIDVQTDPVDENAPLRFVATVDVVPEVDPGPYREVRLPREEPTVTEAEVEARIEDLRARQATLVPAADAAAARGDFVLLRVLQAAPGIPRLAAGKEVLVEIGGGLYPAPLEEGLEGVRRGEERTIPLGDGGGQVTVLAVDVKRRELPAVDDAFARQAGAESVAALREQLRDRLQAEAAARAAENYRNAVLRAVTAGATVDLPRSLVAHEVEHLLADLEETLARRGLTLETYLRTAEKSVEGLRGEYEAVAQERLRTQLVLDEIARREGIVPTEEEITREAENLAQSLQQEVARVRQWLEDESRRGALVRTLRRRKTVEFLVNLASAGNVPAGPEAAPAGEPAEMRGG